MLEEILKTDKELVRLTTAGSVDDGKSTLIGRLLYDCNLIYDDQLEAVRRASFKRGHKDIDLSLLMDGLSAEREQGITIDVAYRYFTTNKRKFVVADVPGHEQYTRNMVTGASNAQVAIILTDARKGLLSQSKRHLFIASLLGIPHILVAVNKMDLMGYEQEIFEKIKNDFEIFAAKLAIHDLQFIPMSAAVGDMVVNRGGNMDWYNGRTLFDYLENVPVKSDRNLIDFRFPVQLVVRPNQDFRGYAGMIESGAIKNGESVTVLPSGRSTIVKSIIVGGEERDMAFAPQSAVIVLADELDVSRGEMIVRPNNFPEVSNELEATLCWFNEEPLREAKSYILKQTTRVTRCSIDEVRYRLNIETLHREETQELRLNEIGRVVIKTNDDLMFDQYTENRNTGNFIIIDELTNNTVGAGVILHSKPKIVAMAAPRGSWGRQLAVFSRRSVVNLVERVINFKDRKKRQPRGFVLWFTGLPCSGKTTISDQVYETLKQRSIKVEKLDGDVVREGLTRDLDFSKDGRDENLRRVGFVAKLLARNGVGVMASFVSPYRYQRQELREKIENFVEIYVNTPLEVCERRDVKGMYARARRGEISNFTGIDDPYEEPSGPEIELRTEQITPEEASVRVIKYLEDRGFI